MSSNFARRYVTITRWRKTGGGLDGDKFMLVKDAGEIADFAVVIVPGGAPLWFELPAKVDALEAHLSALDIAYSLGHRDRVTQLRMVLGFGMDASMALSDV